MDKYMNNQELCPVCCEGHLVAEARSVNLAYAGGEFVAVQHLHACEVCGTEISTADDMRFNARSARAAEQAANGRLTGERIRLIRKALKITQETAGQIFGGGPVAFCKYEKNDLAPTEAMDSLLWLVEKYPCLANDLAERKNIISLNTPEILNDYEVFIKSVQMGKERARDLSEKVSSAISNSHQIWKYGIPTMHMSTCASNDTHAYAQAS